VEVERPTWVLLGALPKAKMVESKIRRGEDFTGERLQKGSV